MGEIEGEVFCVIDSYVGGFDPDLSCDNTRKMWVKKREDLPNLITAEEHSIVSNIDGRKICRPFHHHLTGLISSKEGFQTFGFYCNILATILVEELNKKGMGPNVLVALGGAKILSDEIHFNFRRRNAGLDQGNLVFHKVIKDDILVDFTFGDTSYHRTFDPSSMRVILVEDFVHTGKSIDIATKKLRNLGAEVVAIVSFGNCFHHVWPFNVPINITFMNLDFTKYPAGMCLKCRGTC